MIGLYVQITHQRIKYYKLFKMSELNLNTIGYDYDKVRDQVGSDPVNPFMSIVVYFGLAFVFSTFCVITYYLIENDGDWNRVFEDDDIERKDYREPLMSSFGGN